MNGDAGAASGVGIGSLGPSMLEVSKRFESSNHDLAPRHATEARYQSHTAAVVIVGCVVQAA